MRDKLATMIPYRFTDLVGRAVSSLADDLVAAPAQPRHPGPACAVGNLLAILDQPDADALRALLADRRVSASVIAATLQRHGHDIGGHTVARHRRGRAGGGCRCEVEA